MSRLLEDLLATARKRSAAFVDGDVDLAGLARTVADEHTAAGRGTSAAAGPAGGRRARRLRRPAPPWTARLSNLLSNAVRLAPDGQHHHRRHRQPPGLGLGRRPRRRTRHRRRGPRRVFDRFHRGRRRHHGSGLGLAIARQIVESHDGRLVLADGAGPGQHLRHLAARARRRRRARARLRATGRLPHDVSPDHSSAAIVRTSSATAGASAVDIAAQDARNRRPSSDELPGAAL